MRKSTLRLSQWVNSKSVDTTSRVPKIAYDYLPRILTSQVYDAAIETPLTFAANMSNMFGNHIYLKREDTQPVFSFKIRGAYNKIAKLSPDVLKKGVVTCSAGNHAQGVALSAAKLNIDAIIVMPLATPSIKVNAVRRFGGPTVTVKLHGKNYDEASDEAKRLSKEQGLALIHPFDDPDVIAGQGTIGMEILKSMNGKEPDVIFACVGGGGLLAGIAAYVKAIRPNVKVIGVEADDAAGMTASLIAQNVVTLPHVGLFADGAAVRTVGTETFNVCNQLVDEMVTVSTENICAAIKLGFNDTRCVLEPAGALAIAGMVKYVQETQCKNKKFVVISSGANMDFDRLRFVSERADSSEALIAVQTPEKPGSFRKMQSLLHPRNITEFSYRHDGTDTAMTVVSFQALAGHTLDDDKKTVEAILLENGFGFMDLEHNEVAKTHVRYMAGGRSPKLFELINKNCVNKSSAASGTGGEEKELLYRFEFPEHSGALDRFLSTLDKFNQGWSITLFHYRNHGHDFGRVLVGMVVNSDDMTNFKEFLTKLGYPSYDETDNAAYKSFLV